RQAMLLAADARLPLRAGPALHLLLRGERFSHRAELLDVDELDRHTSTRVGAPLPRSMLLHAGVEVAGGADVVAAIRAAEHIHGDHEAMMAGPGRRSGRGPTESWRARLSRACGGGGVDREPVRHSEARQTMNESQRAGVSIRACGAAQPTSKDACGATQPASKGRLRRCATRGTGRSAGVLARRGP